MHTLKLNALELMALMIHFEGQNEMNCESRANDDYNTYNYLIDLFHPDFHKTAIKQRVAKLREGFES